MDKEYETEDGKTVSRRDSDNDLRIDAEYTNEWHNIYLTKNDLVQMLKMFEEED